ncbi:MAG: hypothetical protein MOB07_10345 [Acidobacteria bacterium]|nr:hypothetical protein [Acidobacteriota bacterium]
MKRTLITLTIVVLFASAFGSGLAFRPDQSSSGSGLAPTARAQEQDDPFERARTRRCSAGTLKGRYGSSVTGTLAGLGPVWIVGWSDFDGIGSFTAADTASLNGAISNRSYSGTYQVNADCTGSLKFVLPPPRVLERNFNFVLVDGGKEGFAIETDPGTGISGVFKRL